MSHVYARGDKVLVTAGRSTSSHLLHGDVCTVDKDCGSHVNLVEELEVRENVGYGGVWKEELRQVNQ